MRITNDVSLPGDHGDIAILESRIEMLTTFIDSGETGMYVSDLDTGAILFANRKMMSYNAAGAEPERLIGKPCWKTIREDYEERCPFCPWDKLITEGGRPAEPYIWELFLEDRQIWLKVISQAIVWVDGRMAQMNTFYDITETKHLQEQIAAFAREKEQRKMQQNLLAALDLLPISVVIADVEDDTVLYGNKALYDLFGFDAAAEIVGRSLYTFLPENNPENVDFFAVKQGEAGTEPMSVECNCQAQNGQMVPLMITSRIIEYNGKMAALCVMEDLTAVNLQKEMLRIDRERERDANRLKSNFLSNMSHEVRTPMNAIIGLTEIELARKTPSESGEIYRKINNSAKSLLQVVNDILDLSKIEANRIDIFEEEFDLHEVLDSALLVVTPRLDGKKVELLMDASLNLPRFLMGDRTRLWQILKNCLDNAAKFTEEGSIILTVAKDEAHTMENMALIAFSIDDTGVGMSPGQIEKMFQPYEQLHNEMQNRYTGTGLGMPITKELCRLMGGILDVNSAPGHGTSVRFTLPFQPVSHGNNKLRQTKDLSGLRILIVDDNILLLKIAGKLLKEGGADYVLASDGEEALELVQEYHDRGTPFDVVLLDYIMERLSGLEAARQIYNRMEPAPKLLLVTAYSHKLDKMLLDTCGLSGVLEKPFTPSAFYEKIRYFAGLQGDEQEKEPLFTRFVGARILVCEDNEINREVAAGMLEQFGIHTVMAHNGLQGLEIMQSDTAFDMILMDLHMPVMDGFEATRAIRAIPKHKNIPIISLTADAMTEVMAQCKLVGMNDYVTKPFDMETMHEILLKWLPRHKRITTNA